MRRSAVSSGVTIGAVIVALLIGLGAMYVAYPSLAGGPQTTTVTLSSIATSVSTASCSSVDTVNMILDFTPGPQHIPFYIGRDLGFFAKYCININIIPNAGGSSEAVSALAAGRADFGDPDAGVLMTFVGTNVSNNNLRIISGYFFNSPNAVVYLSGSGISSPADLQGKTLGSFVGNSVETLFPIFAKNAGIDATKVTITHLAGNALTAPLLNGQVQGLLLTGRFVYDLNASAAAEGKTVHAFYYKDYGVNTLPWSIVTNTNLINNNPGLVQRFLEGFWAATEYCILNPQAAAAQMLKDNPTMASDTQVVWEYYASLIASASQISAVNNPTALGNIPTASLQTTINIISQAKNFTGLQPSAIYNGSFLASQ